MYEFCSLSKIRIINLFEFYLIFIRVEDTIKIVFSIRDTKHNMQNSVGPVNSLVAANFNTPTPDDEILSCVARAVKTKSQNKPRSRAGPSGGSRPSPFIGALLDDGRTSALRVNI